MQQQLNLREEHLKNMQTIIVEKTIAQRVEMQRYEQELQLLRKQQVQQLQLLVYQLLEKKQLQLQLQVTKVLHQQRNCKPTK